MGCRKKAQVLESCRNNHSHGAVSNEMLSSFAFKIGSLIKLRTDKMVNNSQTNDATKLVHNTNSIGVSNSKANGNCSDSDVR